MSILHTINLMVVGRKHGVIAMIAAGTLARYDSAAVTLRDRSPTTRASNSSVSSATSNIGPAAIVDINNTTDVVLTASTGAKDFSTVAKDARSTLNDHYAKAGKGPSIYTSGAEWKDAFEGLDRRSLYAIRSNKDNQFTALEQNMAKTEMQRQMDAVTGQDRAASYFGDNTQIANMYKGSVKFLDSVSNEEKSSFDWAKDRAAAQHSYELISHAENQEPEKLDSTNPLVKMIKAAFDSLKDLGDPSKQVEDMPQYKQAQQLFASQQAGATSAVDIKA